MSLNYVQATFLIPDDPDFKKDIESIIEERVQKKAVYEKLCVIEQACKKVDFTPKDTTDLAVVQAGGWALHQLKEQFRPRS